MLSGGRTGWGVDLGSAGKCEGKRKRERANGEYLTPRFNPALSKSRTHLVGAVESINTELWVNIKEIRALSSKLKRKSFAN